MEIIWFSCPKCGRRLAEPSDLATKEIVCPSCYHLFICAAGVDIRFQEQNQDKDHLPICLGAKDNLIATPGEKPPSRRTNDHQSTRAKALQVQGKSRTPKKTSANSAFWYLAGAILGCVVGMQIAEKYIMEPRRRAEYYTPSEIVEQCYRAAEIEAVEEIRSKKDLRNISEEGKRRYVNEKFQIIYAIQAIRYRRSQGYCTVGDWMKKRREESIFGD